MVNGSQTVSSVASGAAQFARVSSAAVLSADSAVAAGTTEAVATQPADQVVAGNALRYNSFEFSYRQDFGKIVLLRQRPDTGEVVQQFPSEYYLRKYADGQRVAARSAEDGGAAKSAATPEANAQTTVSTASVISAPAPEVAPSVPVAPALPSAGVSAAAPRVDVTI